MTDVHVNDLLQWLGVFLAGATALYSLGKKEQRLTSVEDLAKSAYTLSSSTANLVTGLEAKITLMLGMLERIQRKLDNTDA